MLSTLPLPIRILFNAVVVTVFIAAGGWIASIPYEAGAADPIMVQIFNAVFGTIGFTLIGYLNDVHRARHVMLTVLAVWAITGFAVVLQLLHPVLWVFVLVVLAIMGTLGGGLARLIEKYASE